MQLYWSVRYLDSRDKQFKDRDLHLDTTALDAPTRAAVELLFEYENTGSMSHAILKYRPLFSEGRPLEGAEDAIGRGEQFRIFTVDRYFEDENGEEISLDRIAQIRSGCANAIMFAAGVGNHDIALRLATPSGPIDLKQIHLSQQELDCLAYFVRDVQELRNTEFQRQGAGHLVSAGGSLRFETATTADEIRSYVTVFRRLYMKNEPGNFMKACCAFSRKHPPPLSGWVRGEYREFRRELRGVPTHVPWLGERSGPSFTRKYLIDVVINTKFAHQPDVRRTKQYESLIGEAASEELLTWLFCTTILTLSLHFMNALNPIRRFLASHLECHGARPSFDSPALHEVIGVGVLEKQKDKARRMRQQKAHELAHELWREAGCPDPGPSAYFRDAEAHLKDALGDQV